MPMPDGMRALGEQTIAAVKSFTAREVGPLRESVTRLEAGIAALPSAEFVRAEVAASASKLMLDLLAAVSRSDGKAIAVEDISPLVESCIAALPVPKDGAPGRDGRDGADGASVAPESVQAMVDAGVARALAALPPREDDAKALADALMAKFMAAAVE